MSTDAARGHDAFISYSHAADGRLAPVLERDLERLAKPLFSLRAMDVFRDQTSLAASPGLWSGITAHLERSRWFVLLASRGSAASAWCLKEVEWWLDHHGTQRFLIVLTQGEIAWNSAAEDFDWSRTDALASALRARFAEEPLLVDLRWATSQRDLGHRDPRLRPALLDLAAPIRGVPKDQLDGADVRQQRRTRRLASAAVTCIVAAAAIAVWQAREAIRQRDEAARQRDGALSRQLAAQANELRVREPVLSLLLAVQSHAIVPTTESMTALLRTTNALPLERLHEHGQRWFTLAVRPGSDELVLGDGRGGVYRTTPDQPALGEIAAPSERAILSAASALALSADGQAIASGGYGGIITVRRAADARKLDTEEAHEVFITALAFSPDSRSLASAATGGRLLLHDLASGRHRTIDTAGVDLSRVAFSPDGRLLVAGGDHGLLRAYRVGGAGAAPKLASTGNGSIMSIVFDASGDRLFVASYAGRAEVLDAASGAVQDRVETLEFGAIESFALAPDGESFATGHAGGAVVRWLHDRPFRTWRSSAIMQHAAAVKGLAFLPDGRRLASVGLDGRFFITQPIDLPRWARPLGDTAVPDRPPQPPMAEAASADGRWFAKVETTFDLTGLQGGGRGCRSCAQAIARRRSTASKFRLARVNKPHRGPCSRPIPRNWRCSSANAWRCGICTRCSGWTNPWRCRRVPLSSRPGPRRRPG